MVGPIQGRGCTAVYLAAEHFEDHPCNAKLDAEALICIQKVPAAGFEPAHFGLKELARLSVWPELGYPARSEQELISS